MSSAPQVSVVMPVFNGELTIAEAIVSVLQQTFSRFELIVVDDASTDATSEMVRPFLRHDSRIRLISNGVNSRAAFTPWEPRNDAIRIARAPLFAYLDADNTWQPHFLETMIDLLAARPGVLLVYCDSVNHYADFDQLEAVLERDPRQLVASNRDALTASFSVTIDLSKRPGVDWYVDTNEMVHRACVFAGLGGFWNTIHPRRQIINDSQVIRSPYRRHNDQDLVERILNFYGLEAIYHCEKTMVDFYYSGARRFPAEPEGNSKPRKGDGKCHYQLQGRV